VVITLRRRADAPAALKMCAEHRHAAFLNFAPRGISASGGEGYFVLKAEWRVWRAFRSFPRRFS
jgi:hypothetical protein